MRKNVKTFFSDFRNSLLPQPIFYRHLLRAPLSRSFSYFIMLIFFLNALFLLLFFAKIKPTRLIQFTNEVITELHAFPTDLTVHLNNGHLISSANRPYFFWINHDDEKILIGVIDETATPEKINSYSSFFLLTDKTLVLNRNKLPIGSESISLSGINGTIDRSGALSFAKLISHIFPFAMILFLLVALLILPIVTVIINSIIIALASIGAYILFRFFTKIHTLKKTFQLTLHAATLPLIIVGIISFLNPTIHYLRTPLFLLLIIFSLCALYEAYIDRNYRSVKKDYAHKALK